MIRIKCVVFFRAVATRAAGQLVGGTFVPVCKKFNNSIFNLNK